MSLKLTSTQSLVLAPYITVTIGNNVLGTYSNSGKAIKAPNYINSMSVVKINGAVNQYTIELVYVISPGMDPNYIDKILSSVSKKRMITISYGDCMLLESAFRNEEALITKVVPRVDFASPKISYTITALSSAVYLKGVVKDWPARTVKPSVLIRELLADASTGLKDVFKGMLGAKDIESLIPSNDKEVRINASPNTNSFDYLKQIVSYMIPEKDNNSSIYTFTVFDTTEAPYYGPYFKITEVRRGSADAISSGSYDLDIGYPGDNFVSAFSVSLDDAWSLIYDYPAGVAESPAFSYNKDGSISIDNNPKLARGVKTQATESDLNWWKSVTDYPIKATVTIKGLVKAVNLVEYVHINCIFFGRKSLYSGYYIITKQTDNLGPNGYTTTLELTRVKGEVE